MFQFTESIMIAAPAAATWEVLADVETWWPLSNPEHIRMEIESAERPIGVGTTVAFEERVAGIKGRAEGVITQWIPNERASWEGTAEYRYLGLPFRVREGVSWQVENLGEESRLSARVWAEFPATLFGRILEWYARSLLKVVDRDRAHARRELEYLKGEIERIG
ncbi:MAG: SRPBCC family protein [Gemmatimonadales bacterium]|jgi:hypothetical protein